MTENRYPMFFGCFLVIFGFVISLITICALAFSAKYVRMLCISLFSILIGIWTLGYYDVISIFLIPLYSMSLLEYISLYLAPVPLLIYLWEDVKNLNSRVLGTLYRVILIVQIAASSLMLSLHAFDIVHCAATLKYIQALIVIDLIYFVTIEFMNIKDSRGVERFFILGMLFVVACIAYDLFGYQFNRYWGRDVLIKSAAEVISETFEEYGVVARMGGDEFVAILNTSITDEIDSIMEQFKINMSKKNEEVEDLNMSIAYGFAVCMKIREI